MGSVQFLGSITVVAHVWPAVRVDERLSGQLKRAVLTGNQRTPTQDIEYAINQLVEVAVRAMSPAINDPFTADTCLHYIADGLATYFQYEEIDPNYYDTEGSLRLIFEPASTETLLGAAFDMLRHASCENANVLLHILDAIQYIGQGAKSPQVHEELIRHVGLVEIESCAGHMIEPDKQHIHLFCEQVKQNLKAGSRLVSVPD
jgi:uncharacterized membrane protein